MWPEIACRTFTPSTMTQQTKTTKAMNGLSNLHHIFKKTGASQCSLSQPECGSRSNGMIVLGKSQVFAGRIKTWEKGDFKPCLYCLNAAKAQGRISESTYQKGLEIRNRK